MSPDPNSLAATVRILLHLPAPDLMGGHIVMTVDNISTAAPLVREKNVKAIGVTTIARAPQLPNVPTLDELGLKGFDMPTWQGIFGPANLPADIVQAYYAALQDVLKDPAVIEKMGALGSLPVTGSTPADFDAFFQKDRAQWAKTAKDANIRL